MMKKIIFKIIIVLFVFLIVCPSLLDLIGLEFKNDDVEQSFSQIRFWGILFGIFLIMLGAINKTDKAGVIALKVLLGVGMTILIFFFMAMSVFSSMCDWSNGDILYLHKKDDAAKIIRRYYGCGAIDSQPSTTGVFEVKEIANIFIKVREMNVEGVDENEWLKINKYNDRND